MRRNPQRASRVDYNEAPYDDDEQRCANCGQSDPGYSIQPDKQTLHVSVRRVSSHAIGHGGLNERKGKFYKNKCQELILLEQNCRKNQYKKDGKVYNPPQKKQLQSLQKNVITASSGAKMKHTVECLLEQKKISQLGVEPRPSRLHFIYDTKA